MHKYREHTQKKILNSKIDWTNINNEENYKVCIEMFFLNSYNSIVFILRLFDFS